MSNEQNRNASNIFAVHWDLVLSAGAVMLPICAALLKLLLTVSTLTSTIDGLKARIAGLEAQMYVPRGRPGGFATALPAIHENLERIESQMCAEGTLRNQMHASDLRNIATVWNKAIGGRLPIENAYYPQIGRCVPTSRGGLTFPAPIRGTQSERH